MNEIDVACEPLDEGWSCSVVVRDGSGQTSHRVRVSAADLARFAPGAHDPSQLVVRSFVFLLARESKESILREFALPVIGRYFPEYETEIRRGS